MPREASAGGVVVRQRDREFELAVIRPRGREVWALPKGHVDGEERPEEAAQREVWEETGLRAQLAAPLGEIRYVYQFRGKKIFKRVHFFLFHYLDGEIDRIDPQMRLEVDRAKWIPLSKAPSILAYPGEREVAQKAAALLTASADQASPARDR